mgnify:CR=1 FL=1
MTVLSTDTSIHEFLIGMEIYLQPLFENLFCSANTLAFDYSVNCVLSGRPKDAIADIGQSSGFTELGQDCPPPFEQAEPGNESTTLIC